MSFRDDLRAQVASVRQWADARRETGDDLIASGLALQRAARMSQDGRLIWAEAPFEGWTLPQSKWELTTPRDDLIRGVALVIVGLDRGAAR